MKTYKKTNRATLDIFFYNNKHKIAIITYAKASFKCSTPYITNVLVIRNDIAIWINLVITNVKNIFSIC